MKSNKKYPRIGDKEQKSYPKGLCKICGENKSDYWVSIKSNYFRGDDIWHPVHRKCIKNKKEDELLNVLLKGVI